MAASDTAILAEGLGKSYRSHTALHGIDLAVPAGTVLGVLGPNGAGKTTTVRILATLVRPTGGRATVAGYDVVREGREVRRRIGLAGQYAAVDELLTGRENLVLLARLLRFGRRGAARRAAELLDRFELTEAADRPAGTYSGGMRRRLDLATCVIGDPEVLFLDEPTTGLDPASRNVLWDVVRDLAGGGVTILLTTQYLEEADRLADRVAVIDAGRVIAEGTPDSLKRQVGSDRLEVTVAGPEDLADAVAALAVLGGPAPVTDEAARRVSVQLGPDGLDDLARAAQALRDKGVPTVDIELRKPTLDDVFFDLTGTSGRASPPEEPNPAPTSRKRPAPAAEEEAEAGAGARETPLAAPDDTSRTTTEAVTTTENHPAPATGQPPATAARKPPVPAAEEAPVTAAQNPPVPAAEEASVTALRKRPAPTAEEAPATAPRKHPAPTAGQSPATAARKPSVSAAGEAPPDGPAERAPRGRGAAVPDGDQRGVPVTATATPATPPAAPPRPAAGSVRGHLGDTLALAGRHLTHLRRSPGRLVLVTMNPLVMLIAVGYLFRGSMHIPGGVAYEDFIMAGIAIQVGLTGVGPTAIGVALDLRHGLVDRFRSLPVSPSSVLLGRTLSDLAVGTVSLAAVSLVGLGVGWRPHEGPLRTAAGFGVLLAFVYVMTWVGILLGTTQRNVEAIDGTGALVLVILSFLSNAYVPVSGLPGWLRPVAEWNPVTSVVTTCRRLWDNDPGVAASGGFPAHHPGLVTAVTLTALLLAAVWGGVRGFRRAGGH